MKHGKMIETMDDLINRVLDAFEREEENEK